MTSIGPKAQGKSIKRAVLTGSLLQELSGGEAVCFEQDRWRSLALFFTSE